MAEGIKDKVAIIGMGCIKFGENWDKSTQDMIVEAAYEAFQDAGVESKDIQAAWLGTVYSGEVGVTLSVPLRLQNIPVTRVENRCATGMDAIRNAAFAIASGEYDLVLVLGVEKLKDYGFGGLPTYADRLYFDPPGAALPCFAPIANRYFYHYGIEPMSGKKTLAKISVKNHHNGSMNPKAHFQREVTVEQVMNAPIMAWPLGLLDCCPVADGAAAAVLCRADMAKKFRDDYLLVKAIEITAGPGNFCSRDDYDYVHWEETVTAAQRAYEKVGVKEPFKELSMVEVHDCFTITELITYEDLLLCPRGESSRFVESGVFTLEGECPVNPDGGLKSFGHPLGASGLRMVYEMWLQFHHKAGGRQIKKPFELGLAHNLGGTLDGYIIAVGIIGAP